jgi:ectoine hydroxylase-related dioxygenase (phytanoyl-CoA dioxygenase family)
MPPLSAEQVEGFDRQGYIILPRMINGRQLRQVRRELAKVETEAIRSTASDHDTVIPPSNACAFQFEHDATGKVATPRRLHKAQGVGLISQAVLTLIRAPPLASAATQLSGERELDAFGSKYFPVRAGSVGSVGWHDDNYYFGTTRSRTISCVVYLRSTTPSTGCLRVYPGSHRDAQVGPERYQLYADDKERHGEYIPEARVAELAKGMKRPRDAVDVAVPEGSAILFDANLLHAAHSHEAHSADDMATSE